MNTFPHCFLYGVYFYFYYWLSGSTHILTHPHKHWSGHSVCRKSLSYHAYAAAGSGVVPARRFFSFLQKISGFQQMNRSNFNGGEGSRGGLTHTYLCTCNFQDDHRMRADRQHLHNIPALYMHYIPAFSRDTCKIYQAGGGRKENNLFSFANAEVLSQWKVFLWSYGAGLGGPYNLPNVHHLAFPASLPPPLPLREVLVKIYIGMFYEEFLSCFWLVGIPLASGTL